MQIYDKKVIDIILSMKSTEPLPIINTAIKAGVSYKHAWTITHYLIDQSLVQKDTSGYMLTSIGKRIKSHYQNIRRLST